MKACGLVLSLGLLLSSTPESRGVVELSPSPVALVCPEGDQLELICTIAGEFKRWEFKVALDSGLPQIFMPGITPDGVAPPVTVNSTTFTVSRLSALDSSTLISRMTINRVSEGLNGVTMSCVDVMSSESANTTIRIVNAGDLPTLSLIIQTHSEQFSIHGITLLLECTISLSQTYYQQLLRNVSIFIAPDSEVTATYVGNRILRLTLQYNTHYNVSITQPGICGQPNQTAFIELNYSKCNNPTELTHNNVQVMGYDDPALEGENIVFTCASGLKLGGSNSSICMENGEWEPDPGEANCTVQSTDPVICGHPQYVFKIKDSLTIMTYTEFKKTLTEFFDSLICCSGIAIIEADTITCLQNVTELGFERCVSNNDKMRDTLIAVSCVLVVVSAVMLIIGFLSGHYLGQKYRKSHDQATNNTAATPNPSSEGVDDLELNKNVAYITLRPR